MPLALTLLGLSFIKGIIDVIRYDFGITTNAVLLFISGLLIFTLALLADLIVRSRGET